MKKLAALAATLLVTACGQDLKPEEIRHAMPAAGVLAITAPNPNGATGKFAAEGDPLLAVAPAPGGPSPLAVSSWLFATAVNGGVFWTLAPIAWFTQVVPPTRCDADACTWGPGSGAADLNVWKLVVARNGDALRLLALGAPRSTGGTHLVTVIAGRAWPGTLPNRGHGGFERRLRLGLGRPRSRRRRGPAGLRQPHRHLRRPHRPGAAGHLPERPQRRRSGGRSGQPEPAQRRLRLRRPARPAATCRSAGGRCRPGPPSRRPRSTPAGWAPGPAPAAAAPTPR